VDYYNTSRSVKTTPNSRFGGEAGEEESFRVNICIVGGVGLLENVEECREFQARDAKCAVGALRTSSGANLVTQGKWNIVSWESLVESFL
jgi:hypothetical protein